MGAAGTPPPENRGAALIPELPDCVEITTRFGDTSGQHCVTSDILSVTGS